VALELLGSLGIAVTEKGECHTAVKDGLINSDDTDLRKVGSELGTLATERRYADYKLTDPRTENFAQVEPFVELARDIIQMMDGFAGSCSADRQKGPAIAAKILQWATQIKKANALRKK
jgi:hypothetical protein